MARQGHHDANQRALPGWYSIDARQYLFWQRRPARPACDGARSRVPYPHQAHPPIGSWGPAVRSSRLRTRPFGLVSGRSSLLLPDLADGRRDEHGRMLPKGEPLTSFSEASAELVRPQRPERAWASESLSVLHMSHQQRRTGCAAWCEERAGTASPEASVRAKGCVFICPINREKQRGDVSETERARICWSCAREDSRT